MSNVVTMSLDNNKQVEYMCIVDKSVSKYGC